jgi:Fe-S-cluster-containing dehydrogenase component
VRFHPETGLPMICDLCGGDPQCVKRCATGALKFGRAGDQLPLAPAERYLAPPDMPPAAYDGAPGPSRDETGGEQA